MSDLAGMRSRLGAPVHEEYITALVDAKIATDRAIVAMDPALARRAIADAIYELGRADTRLAGHAAPPA